MDFKYTYRVPHCSLDGKIVFSSAVLYCFSCFCLDYLFWCIIPSLALLLWVLVRAHSFFSAVWQGLLWGGIVYGAHLGCVFYSLYIIRPHWVLIIVWFFSVFYLALHTLLLFTLSLWFQKKVRIVALRIIVCSLLVFSYFIFMDTRALWIFCVDGGYCLASPSIALGYFFPSVRQSIAVPANLACIRTNYGPCQDIDPNQCMVFFFESLAHARCKNDSIQGVVTPESALPFPLNKHPQILRMLCDYSHIMPLLVGSFYEHEQGVDNSYYYFIDGALSAIIIKQHLMPLTEMMPWWCDCEIARALFLKNSRSSRPFDNNKKMNRECCALGNDIVYPLICSEIFCTDALKKIPHNAHALMLVNDSWFKYFFLARATYIYASVKAWWYGKKMLYVSWCCDNFF